MEVDEAETAREKVFVLGRTSALCVAEKPANHIKVSAEGSLVRIGRVTTPIRTRPATACLQIFIFAANSIPD